MNENMSTAAARRAQELEAKYSRDLRSLRQAKEDDLAQLDERFKLLRSSYNMERIQIKEDIELRRLNLKTQIARLHDKRANLRHALSIQDDRIDPSDAATLEDFTTRINNLQVELIGIERKRAVALNDAEAKFASRSKEIAEERRAINKHYINEAELLHEQYLAIVEQHRQLRRQEEGGEAV